MSLPPWAAGPFELIVHGETHYRSGGDFDRRVALISFDNAIEVSIATYLSLNPIQRQGRSYQRTLVEHWAQNFHTKLEFIESECQGRGIALAVDRTHMVWYHDLRNDQYHGGRASTPNLEDLTGVRLAALWVFSTLYDIANIEHVLEERLLVLNPPASEPMRNADLDTVIDAEYGDVKLAGGLYPTSELLFQVDHEAYREIGMGLLADESQLRIVS